jgi:hypothetical protein
MMLAPEIQETVLVGTSALELRQLMPLCRRATWSEQRRSPAEKRRPPHDDGAWRERDSSRKDAGFGGVLKREALDVLRATS